LDEAGVYRHKVEAYITQKLANRRHRVVVTSRQPSLTPGTFALFKMYAVLPLTPTMQLEVSNHISTATAHYHS